MSEKRKIVVLIDKNALSVEKEIADEAYTWEDYPDAKLRAADRLCEAAKRADCLHWDELNKAIADYEGKQ